MAAAVLAAAGSSVAIVTSPANAEAGAQAAPTSAACARLAALTIPQARVTTAQLVEAGAFTVPGGARANPEFATLPAFCRVAATLTPSADSHIEMEVWMPAEGWNGKFLAVGNGGWAGSISFGAMAEGLRRGYATASNDTGHQDSGARFALSHEKAVDFGYRAMHEMTVHAKAIVARFYDRPPQLSYYQGCSTGGRQGMMEAQRYPEDFDAIIAGAPVHNQIHLNISQVALQVEMLRNPDRIVPPDKVKLFADAVMNACDARDGVRDGIISDPQACTFDPATLACSSSDGADCLTQSQVASAKQLHSPVKTAAAKVVYPRRAAGVEAGWAARIPVPGKPMNPLWGDMARFVGHRDANWDVMTFDLAADLALALKNASFIEASDPDLSRFKARGGKLLLWHGWADPGPSPYNTIDYHSQVEQALGGEQDDWMRLFLLPGVAHCGGGVGPDQADFLTALERWREDGVAPDRIVATRPEGRGRTAMTRPLCPHPQVARYRGTGSTDDASSFVCAAP
jgi:feruloyl esterase